VIQDDASDEKTAVRAYDKVITEDRVDAVLGPYSSPITDAVAEVTEKHRKLLIAPFAGTTSLWEKGRKNLIMVISPVELHLNVKMFSSLPYGGLPDYQKRLEKSTEFVYSATFWEPSLPYPGNREFVSAYEKEFNRAPALQSANGYAGCQLFAEAARRAGSLDSDKLREALLKLRTKTILGDFAIDDRGFQVAHKAVTTQWQDAKQVVLWPDEIAVGKPRFPTPGWNAR
jgi:ABC-type branched-subunit amino acid transport system substrate-binding protein